ncbi:hypothetical protein HanRHA438_Chr10g0444601 [Helianthus annuus]|nr:hypothetical protein HanRHA438_Chr10g0444601 [Helianthus annuus]
MGFTAQDAKPSTQSVDLKPNPSTLYPSTITHKMIFRPKILRQSFGPVEPNRLGPSPSVDICT